MHWTQVRLQVMPSSNSMRTGHIGTSVTPWTSPTWSKVAGVDPARPSASSGPQRSHPCDRSPSSTAAATRARAAPCHSSDRPVVATLP